MLGGGAVTLGVAIPAGRCFGLTATAAGESTATTKGRPFLLGSTAADTGISPLVNGREAVRPQHDRVAVDGEALGLDPLGGCGDRRQSRSPVKGVAGVEPDRGTVPTHNKPVAVMFDFVNPISTG